MRQPVCRWLERDANGRPSCIHGPAHADGNSWSCRRKARERQRRYRATEKGAAYRRSENRKPGARSSKQLYDLTRIRVS